MDQAMWDRMTPAERDAARDLSGLSPQLVGLEGWRVGSSGRARGRAGRGAAQVHRGQEHGLAAVPHRGEPQGRARGAGRVAALRKRDEIVQGEIAPRAGCGGRVLRREARIGGDEPMRIYSDVLSLGHLSYAARGTGVEVGWVAVILRPKLRRNGWRVQTGGNGPRWKNTGKYGASRERAAIWASHGKWLARLFELDPLAVVIGATRYAGREDFHGQTKGAFAVEVKA